MSETQRYGSSSWQTIRHSIMCRWSRAIRPPDRITDLDERRRSQFLASLLLSMTGVLITVLPIRYLLLALSWQEFFTRLGLAMTGTLLVLGAYFINQKISYRLARDIAVTGGTFIVALSSFLTPPTTISNLIYLIIILFLAGYLYHTRGLLVVALSHLLCILIVNFLDTSQDNSLPFMQLIGVYALAVVIIIAATRHQRATNRIYRAELARSEARFQAVVNTMLDYTFIVYVQEDGGFALEWASVPYPDARPHEGITQEQIMNLFGRVHPADLADTRYNWQKNLAGESIEEEYRIQAGDGPERILSVRRKPILSPDGTRVERIMGIGQDITAKRHEEAEHLKLMLEREQLSMVEQFVTAISHDFRTSLTSIETNRYLIERRLGGDPQHAVAANLTRIHESVQRLTHQIENLYTITTVSNRPRQKIDFTRLIRYILPEHQSATEKSAIRTEISLAPSLPDVVGDEIGIRTAMRALLTNARTHITGEGIITIRTEVRAEYVGISVEDTGAGIPDEHLKHIFHLFYRIDDARTLDKGGIGIGLSLVQMIARVHNGYIDVWSEPGRGSRFTIWLPTTTATSEMRALSTREMRALSDASQSS